MVQPMPSPTLRLSTDAAGIARAAEILRAGGLVAFPTETVYGLGAHALDVAAVRRIFEAKGRPADDPLIVHIASVEWVPRIATLTPLAERLADCFWPGPLTLVLPKLPVVPREVTAGLDTVAVRVPAHPVAGALLRNADVPIAAPSANLFSRPSPTCAEHVLDDLEGRIDAVLDGGPTQVGVESTIVDLTHSVPRLLRPGGLPAEAIEAVIGTSLDFAGRVTPGPQRAPGLLPTHYAPRTPLVLIVGPPADARARLIAEMRRAVAEGRRVGALLHVEDVGIAPDGVYCEIIEGDASQIAARFFAALRALDRRGCDVLFTRQLAPADSGLGRALADRLRRAAAQIIEA
jgi:L-threonylcarbamoyladenylate synthase